MRSCLLLLLAACAAPMLAACSSEPGSSTPPGSDVPSDKECDSDADCAGTSTPSTCGPERRCVAVTECSTDADCAGTDTPSTCTPEGVCLLAKGWEIGFRDGSPASVTLLPVWEPDKPRSPTDLAFNPSKPTELWVVNEFDDSAVIIQNPGMPDSTFERRHDPAASHFMNKPPAIAMGVVDPEWGQTFGVCSDVDQGGGSPEDFIGPSLFSADLSIFAAATPGGLGSHLDMLHSTSFCRGIAHVKDNVFFAFNSDEGALDRYDFKEDHGPGNDDHSDGEILRYAAGTVKGVDQVPSHLFHDSDGMLYVADTGNGRIVRLDTNTGTMGQSFGGGDPIQVRQYVDGATVSDVVAPGTLQQPSGIELKNDLIYVTDVATSRFYVFEKATGKLIRHLDTAMPAGTLAGFTFGPSDGKIYFIDRFSSRVYRIDPL